MNLKLENIKPVNGFLLVETIKEDKGPKERQIAGAGGAVVNLAIFSKDGQYVRVKVISASEGTAEYKMVYKTGDVLVVPKMGFKADYTIDGREYTFVSMHSVIAKEQDPKSFSERISGQINGSVN